MRAEPLLDIGKHTRGAWAARCVQQHHHCAHAVPEDVPREAGLLRATEGVRTIKVRHVVAEAAYVSSLATGAAMTTLVITVDREPAREQRLLERAVAALMIPNTVYDCDPTANPACGYGS